MLGNPGLNYLGYRVSEAGMLPLPSHMAAVSGVSLPVHSQGAPVLPGNGELLQEVAPRSGTHPWPPEEQATVSGSRKVSEQKVPITVTFCKYHSYCNIP
jgi:hypothetical protein